MTAARRSCSRPPPTPVTAARRSPSGCSPRSPCSARSACSSPRRRCTAALCSRRRCSASPCSTSPRTPVPRRRAGGRLHRRRDDAVPVRADAGRRRLRATRWSRRCAASGSPPSLAGLGFGALLIVGLGDAIVTSAVGLDAGQPATATSQALANLIFSRYVFAFEVTSALLITAALGAMVLAHRERTSAGSTQPSRSERRFRGGAHPAAAARPRRLRRHNAVDTPALLPDGTPAEVSVSRVARRPRRIQVRPALRHSPRPRSGRPSRATREGTTTDEPDELRLPVGAAVLDRAAGVLLRRNAIVVFMCVELMLNADQPRLRDLRPDARQPRRPGHRVLRHGRGGRRGRRRPGDHRDDLPHPPLGLGRRRQPAEVLRDADDD